MSSDEVSLGSDYWDLGTSSTWIFEGEDGLERLSGPSRVRAAVPTRFRAQLTRVQLDHVALEALQATPHRAARTSVEIESFPTPLLTFVLLAEGTMRIEIKDVAFEVHAGECIIFDSRDPMTYSTSTEVRMLRSVVGIEHVPDALQRRGATIAATIERTALIDSFIAFASTVLKTAVTGRPARGEHLIRAVADLQSGVLAEAQRSTEPLGAAGLLFRMEEYIAANYTDPDLDPGSIATALGISLRHAHNVFDKGDRTIARVIRDHRIAAVALELRSTGDRAKFGQLARRYGFSSADHLGRVFRQRFGMTLSEYHTGGHRSFG